MESFAKGDWMVWFCHCPSERVRRKALWEELTLKVKAGLKEWVCMGDFNDVVYQDEKMGGKKVSTKANYFLRNFIYDVGALDLAFHGNAYT